MMDQLGDCCDRSQLKSSACRDMSDRRPQRAAEALEAVRILGGCGRDDLGPESRLLIQARRLTPGGPADNQRIREEIMENEIMTSRAA
jgi:hypothetical protein